MPKENETIPRLLRRGGANNRADRTSWQLTEHDCRKLLRASRLAIELGMPLNRFITISWELCGLDPKLAVWATGAWIKLAREWVGANGSRMPWVWVQECGPKLGAHCHILLHVPQTLAPLFSGKPERWARSVIASRQGAYAKGTVRTRKIAMAVGGNALNEAYEAALMGKLHYMLKTAPAHAEAKLGMIGWSQRPWGEACLVYGKRAGAWQFRSVA